jgi:RecB family exonuclease
MTASALAVLREERHVSVSSVGCYMRCPEQYRHRYIARTTPSHRSSALAFGSAFHTALATFYTAIMNCQPEPSADDLVATFTEAWEHQLDSAVPVLFDKDDTKESLGAKGIEMLKVFHAEAPRPHRVLGVKEAFSVEIADPTAGEVFEERLVGAIDAIVQFEEGGAVHLLEHKTGARKRSFANDLQGAAYSYVARHIGLGDIDAVTFQLATKTRNLPSTSRQLNSPTATAETSSALFLASSLPCVPTVPASVTETAYSLE